jgi:hypothetical protein
MRNTPHRVTTMAGGGGGAKTLRACHWTRRPGTAIRRPCPPLLSESPLNLTAEQVAAAEAAGCRFVPVPSDGPHRYAMQRKLFRLAAGEMLATRGGGLYETAATLERLIADGMALIAAAPSRPVAPAQPAVLAQPAAVAQPAPDPAEPDPVPAGSAGPAPLAVAAETEAAPSPAPERMADAAGVAPVPAQEASETDPDLPPPPPPPRTPRRRRTPAAPKEPGAATAPAMPAAGEDPATSRSRRAPESPRWATAGAARRGRTDQHWTKRGR